MLVHYFCAFEIGIAHAIYSFKSFYWKQHVQTKKTAVKVWRWKTHAMQCQILSFVVDQLFLSWMSLKRINKWKAIWLWIVSSNNTINWSTMTVTVNVLHIVLCPEFEQNISLCFFKKIHSALKNNIFLHYPCHNLASYVYLASRIWVCLRSEYLFVCSLKSQFIQAIIDK